jgi:hypothetical protein
LRFWQRSTDETQQSAYLKDLNYFQSNQGLYRYLTSFMSNPIQIMNLELQTLRDMRKGHKDARKKLLRQLAVNHLLVPTVMQFITDVMKRGADPEHWSDWEFENYLFGWLAGPFEAFFLLGKIGMLGAKTIAAKIRGKSAFEDNISALPLLDEVLTDANAAFMYGSKDLKEALEYDYNISDYICQLSFSY